MRAEPEQHAAATPARALRTTVASNLVLAERYEDARSLPVVEGLRGDTLAVTLLGFLFRHYPRSLAVRLWVGETFWVGRPSGQSCRDARFTLIFRHPRAVSSLILSGDPWRFADAYLRSDIDVEGDLFDALTLKDQLTALHVPARDRLKATVLALRLSALNPRKPPGFGENVPSRSRDVRLHSKNDDQTYIHFHHDVSNRFYQLWLDRAMVDSCAYFEHAHRTLDEAQTAKLDHVCRKLLLRPNERFLDIGCGWGALLIHAAASYGVYAHGITLSENQLRLARHRVSEAGLAERVTVERRDYRDLPAAEFDKVASVGMFEHVGSKNLPLYFATVGRSLKPGGLFLHHGITHARPGRDGNFSTEFINRYLFPDVQLEYISHILQLMEDAQFEIEDVESLRSHYAMTLRLWVNRLEQHHEESLNHVSEATFRVWQVYMAACAQELEAGRAGIYQILASKRGVVNRQLPLTRHHLYSDD